jgi:hypothetical protein
MSAAARPSVTARRSGYVLAAAIMMVLWLIVNVWPGWEALPFLTQRTGDVLWAVNLSLLASLLANLAYVVYDPVWFKALGDLITTALGVVPAVLLWRVFPFDFSGSSSGWGIVARVVLMVGIVGGTLGILVQIGMLVRLVLTGGPSGHRRTEVHR